MAYSNLRTVLMLSGKIVRTEVYIAGGAFIRGTPTAYIFTNDGRLVWVKPGASVAFVEVA